LKTLISKEQERVEQKHGPEELNKKLDPQEVSLLLKFIVLASRKEKSTKSKKISLIFFRKWKTQIPNGKEN
jgi:hypothetical protein